MRILTKAKGDKKPTEPKPKGTANRRKPAQPLTPTQQSLSNQIAGAVGALRASVDSPAIQDALNNGHINTSTDRFPWSIFDTQLALTADPLAEITARALVQPHLLPKKIVVQTRFNHSDPRVVNSAKSQASKLASSMTKEQYGKVRTIIGNGVQQGMTVKQISQQLRNHIGINARQDKQMTGAVLDATQAGIDAGLSGDLLDAHVQGVADSLYQRLLAQRANMIARTETMMAQNSGFMLGVQQSVEDPQSSMDNTYLKRWIATDDERTCETCGAIDGTEIPLDEDFELDSGDTVPYPLADGSSPHPNCFPAGVMVQSRALTGAVKRFYKGELVELKTREGLFLSVTPNHPILTRRGWVAAQFVNEGDEVFSYRTSEGDSLFNVDDNDVPTAIEKVVESFSRVSSVVSSEVPTSTPHFHGDGIDGEIAIVFSDSRLNTNRKARFFKPLSQRVFVTRSRLSQAFFTLCASNELLLGMFNASYRVMRSLRTSAMLFGCFILGDNNVRFGLSAKRDSMLLQNSRHGSSSAVEFLADLQDASLLYEVKSDDLRKFSVDVVAHKHKIPFAGDVYNLETVDGWYIANGIVTHNCRCTVGIVPPDRSVADVMAGTAADSIDAQAAMDAAAMGADFTASLNNNQKIINEALALFNQSNSKSK